MIRSQLRTTLWLRWRLSRNQWARGGHISAIITLLFLLLGLVAGWIGGLVGLLAGIFGLSDASPMVVFVLWDILVLAFLFFWMIGLVSEIQRSETIDIRRMMHLPIALRPLFYMNYLASHLCFSIAVFLPGMLGLVLGLSFGRHWTFLFLGPLVLCFLFMITAWTYCLRGWLVGLMVNPRRRRAVVAGITLAMILICQLPNLFSQIHLRKHRRHRKQEAKQTTTQVDANKEAKHSTAQADTNETEVSASPRPPKPKWPPIIMHAHKAIPFLWVGQGALSLAEGQVWPALLGALGCFGLGALGLRRAYNGTLNFYLGRSPGKRSKDKSEPIPKPQHSGRLLVTRTLPGVGDDTAALGLTFLRSHLRAPEIKMMLATNFIMLVVFGVIFLARSTMNPPDELRPIAISGAVAITFFGLTQLMFNLFGPDRSGFRALVLCPVPRYRLLIGKNIALFPFALILGFLLILLAKFALKIPAIYLVCGLCQLVTAFLVLSVAGNLFSTLVPYRIAVGSLKPTKPPALIVFLQFITHLCFPLLLIPVFLPGLLGLLFTKAGWSTAAPVNLVVSFAVLLLAFIVYRLCLPTLGRLLQRREQKILEVVTQEVE